MMIRSRRCPSSLDRALLGSAAGLMIAATPAFAAEAPAETTSAASETGGDIIVTARKRAESIVAVPDAITAFGEKQIQQTGIRTLRDFANLTPNITVTSGSGTAYPNIMVRGLAQAQGGEAPIAVVIDGVQVAQPAFINQDYGDVAQVEVLRGPQGSLYGRNAIGGAINITTRQPTNDFEGRAKISYGNANAVAASGDISGPIVMDKILFRLGGSYNRTDGQVRGITTGDRADGGRSLFLRGRLIFNLTDDLTLDLRGNYGHDHVGILSAEIVSRANFDDFKPGFLASDPTLVDNRTIYDISGKLEYKGDYLTISSVTGYSHVKDTLFGDGDFSPVHAVLQSVRLKVKALTEEIRITSPSDGRFRWLVGAFYQDRDTNNFLEIPLDDGTGQPVPGAFAIQSRDVGSSKSWAAFGSASYDITTGLELTVGARYDEDKRRSVDQVFAGSAAGQTFDSFQPKIQIAYKLAPQLNLYATYGRGFSSGGFNAFYSGPAARRYKAETAENYEAGIKGSLANGLLTFSASGFRVFYRNQQFFFVTANPPTQNITNIDKTRVDGAEIELTARPMDGLDISAGFGLTDAKIRRFAAQPSSVGNRSPQNTRYTLNLSGQYSLPVSDDLNLRAYASYRRQGTEYWDAANTLATPPKDFVNLRLFLENEVWSIGAFVNNLTDSQFPTIAAADAAGVDGNLRIPSARRTYGVEASYRF